MDTLTQIDTPIRTMTNQTFIKALSVSNDIALVGSELNNANQGNFTYSLNGGQLVQTMQAQAPTTPPTRLRSRRTADSPSHRR